MSLINNLIEINTELQQCQGISDGWFAKVLSVYIKMDRLKSQYRYELEPHQFENIIFAMGYLDNAKAKIINRSSEKAIKSILAATDLVYKVQLEVQGIAPEEADTLSIPWASIKDLIQSQQGVQYGLPDVLP